MGVERISATLSAARTGQTTGYSRGCTSWAKKWVSVGTKRISLEDLRRVLGLESAKDAEGNVIQEAPLPVWANFRQRALDIAVVEITKKGGSAH